MGYCTLTQNLVLYLKIIKTFLKDNSNCSKLSKELKNGIKI